MLGTNGRLVPPNKDPRKFGVWVNAMISFAAQFT